MAKEFDYESVPGDYHYNALTKGNKFKKFWHVHKIEILKRNIKINKNDKVLDMGCGSGNVLFNLSKKAKLLCGTDINRNAIKFINEKAKREGISNVKAVKTEKDKRLPFRNSSFDKIIVTELIEHLAEPSILMRECHRILKPDGLLFVTTPDHHSFWPVLEFINDLFKITPNIREEHLTRFNRKNLRKFLKNNNFKILKYGSFYLLSPFVSVISEKLSKQIFELELKTKILPGMLIYCVLKKI